MSDAEINSLYNENESIRPRQKIGTVHITYPNGGENWESGTQNVSWTVSGNIDDYVDLQYTTDNGNNWNVLQNAVAKSSSPYSWSIPNGINSSHCRVKVVGYFNGNNTVDESDETFSIITPTNTAKVVIVDKQLNRIPAVISQQNFTTLPLRFSNYTDIDGDRGPLDLVVRIQNSTNAILYCRPILASLKDPEGNLVNPNNNMSYGTPSYYKLQPNEDHLFEVYILLPNPKFFWETNFPKPGQWQANIQIQQKDNWLSFNPSVVSSFWVPFEVKQKDEPLVASPPNGSDAIGHILAPKSVFSNSQDVLYGIAKPIELIIDLLPFPHDGTIGFSFLDYYEQLEKYQDQLKTLYTLRLKSDRTKDGPRTFNINVIHNQRIEFEYDRAILSVLLPPGITEDKVLDKGGSQMYEGTNGQVILLWIINGVDKRINLSFDWKSHGLYFKIDDSGLQNYKIDAGLQLLLGPFQGDNSNFTNLVDAPWIYNYKKWESNPADMYWYPVTLSYIESNISNSYKLLKTRFDNSKDSNLLHKITQSNYIHNISNGFTLDDGTELLVPTNVFSQDFKIDFEHKDSILTIPGNFNPSSNEYIINFDSQIQDSTNPTLTIMSSDSGVQAADQSIFQWDQSNSKWKILPSIVDSTDHEISTQLASSGIFRAFRSNSSHYNLSTVELVSPKDTSIFEYEPVFRWYDSTGVSWKYLIQLNFVPDFTSPIINLTTNDKSFPLTNLLNEGTYYWRVCRTTIDGSKGTWSPVASFKILADSISPKFTFIYPDSGQSIYSDSAISIGVEDNGTGIDPLSLNLTIDNSDVGFNFDSRKGILSSSKLSNLAIGNHIFKMSTADFAGNVSSISIPFVVSVTQVKNEHNTPLIYQLSQNYPNPFNPTTTIKYSVPKISYVTIKIYDVLGREIETLVNGKEVPGNYSIEFNAIKLASGVYFYRMQAGSFAETKKLLLLK